jgi:hypothetical protein
MGLAFEHELLIGGTWSANQAFVSVVAAFVAIHPPSIRHGWGDLPSHVLGVNRQTAFIGLSPTQGVQLSECQKAFFHVPMCWLNELRFLAE